MFTDSMAIGGNHFIHILRRNLDVNILLFNNHIYGLTKGQFSPTTPIGTTTKTSPYGTIERPFVTAGLVMGAQGTFFARVPDSNIKVMTEVMLSAARHKGTSVIEILQNCIIFADGTHRNVTDKLADILVHNQYEKNPGIQRMLGKMNPPDLPLAPGVIKSAKSRIPIPLTLFKSDSTLSL